MSVENMAYVSFGGVRSDSTALGLKMLSMPKRTKPQRQGKAVTIAGRSGDLFIDYGAYGTVSVKVDFMLTDLSKLSAVNQWLSGSGWLVLGDMPNRAYKARCDKMLQYTPATNHTTMQRITIEWTCQPWMYVYPESATTTYNTSGQGQGTEVATIAAITNAFNAASAPIIEVVTDTSGMDFSLELYRGSEIAPLWTIDFYGVPSTDIIIDGELQDAVNADYTSYLNQYMDGEYPYFPVGTSTLKLSNVSKTGGETVNVTQIKITPRWRDI